MSLTSVPKPDTAAQGIDELFNRVNMLLGEPAGDAKAAKQLEGFVPRQPRTMRETGIPPVMIEKIIMRFLLQVGAETSRRIAGQILNAGNGDRVQRGSSERRRECCR